MRQADGFQSLNQPWLTFMDPRTSDRMKKFWEIPYDSQTENTHDCEKNSIEDSVVTLILRSIMDEPSIYI